MLPEFFGAAGLNEHNNKNLWERQYIDWFLKLSLLEAYANRVMHMQNYILIKILKLIQQFMVFGGNISTVLKCVCLLHIY